MYPKILLVRDDDGFRVLHGHLHLAQTISQMREAHAIASGEGEVKIVKTADGIFVDDGNLRFPLLAK